MLWVFEQINQQTDRQTAGQTELSNFNIDKKAQNHNKGTKLHRMALNENEKAKNSPELLKR